MFNYSFFEIALWAEHAKDDFRIDLNLAV